MPEATKGQSSDWPFQYTYTRLPADLWVRIDPEPAPAPSLVVWNERLAEGLGIDRWAGDGETQAAVFSGRELPPGARPIAQAYAGHQFGHFNLLGDGRAVLLGEWVTPTGERVDIQLKGSGRTPFSRRGDGRAALGPMLREFIVSEGMAALGIPTTRSLAVVRTGEPVLRERPLPGAALTRVAQSHIRVGTFEWAVRTRSSAETVRALADYVIQRHYPEVADAENPYLALLQAVIARQAVLVSQWLQVGFIHGVMNSDNMSIAGETIDYGPCAFMDVYHPDTVFSSIDSDGRYAYANQPTMALWNLTRFAETLLPLLAAEMEQAKVLAQDALGAFNDLIQRDWRHGMGRKLGLEAASPDDEALIHDLLTLMADQQADFTLTFRQLAHWLRGDVAFEPAWEGWLARWRQRLEQQGVPLEVIAAQMDGVNPAVIPRNHHVEQVLAAAEAGDLAPLHALWAALRDPWVETEENARWRQPPKPHERVTQTFCGT